MSDIVTRLWGNTANYPGFENIKTEAAREIERLRARVAELEADIKDFQDTSEANGLLLTQFVKDRDRWKVVAGERHKLLLGLEWTAEPNDETCCPVCMRLDDERHRAGCKMAEAINSSTGLERADNGEVKE